MSSATIYATDPTYSNINKGAATLSSVLTATTGNAISQTSNYVGLTYFASDGKYWCFQHMVKFDLSSIPVGSVISSATLTTQTPQGTVEAHTAGSQLELLPYSWGTVEDADYLTQTEVQAIAAVATYPLTGTIAAGATQTFTSGAPLIASLTPGSSAYFMLCNKAYRDGTAPTGYTDQSLRIYTTTNATSSYRPTLSIVYTAGSPATTRNATFFGSNF